MDLIIEPLKVDTYDTILRKWWVDWGWTPPQKEFLPDNGNGGLIVYADGVPVCAGFLYVTNSKVSWVDWIISNKEFRDKPFRKQAMMMLIDSLTNISKNLGNKYVYALIKHPSLIETYKGCGYKQGDTYTSEMIKIL
jgi:hypothetical protein